MRWCGLARDVNEVVQSTMSCNIGVVLVDVNQAVKSSC